MLSDIIITLAAPALAKYGYDALRKVVEQFLATKNIRLESTDKEEFIAELAQKAEQIQAGETPEESSRITREIVEKQANILAEERARLIPIAAREHWVALGFAMASGAVFVVAIVLAIQGSVKQAIVSLIASAIPGFLSKVFYKREASMETRIKEISTDMRDSEKVGERLKLLEQALSVVPENTKDALVKEFSKKAFAR
jgi:hypothetical protein